MAGRWGPEGKQAAVTFTFDHLGEASDIEHGRWPTDRPVGKHHSVVRDLPLILDALAGTCVTFFIESWNLHVYPHAIEAVVDAGHEIGSHGLRHETWSRLSRDQERDHLKRCIDDYARYGIEIKGLRPPGTSAAPGSAEILPELGLTYISPVGVSSGVMDTGLAVLDCAVAAADVAFYVPQFTKYRKYKPSDQTLPPEDLVEGMMAEIEKAVADGDYIAPVCHPFHVSPAPDHTDPARVEALAEVVRRINADERIWHAPAREVADWMLQNKEDFPGPESLDPPEYWDPPAYKDIKRAV